MRIAKVLEWNCCLLFATISDFLSLAPYKLNNPTNLYRHRSTQFYVPLGQQIEHDGMLLLNLCCNFRRLSIIGPKPFEWCCQGIDPPTLKCHIFTSGKLWWEGRLPDDIDLRLSGSSIASNFENFLFVLSLEVVRCGTFDYRIWRWMFSINLSEELRWYLLVVRVFSENEEDVYVKLFQREIFFK